MQGESTNEALLESALGGDCGALAELFQRYRARLEQMVLLRMDRRLRGRLDPADVLQEAYLDVADRPGGAGPAALRNVEQRGDRTGAGPQAVGREQPPSSRLEAAQGDHRSGV
jgi:hypothetical protein